MYKLPERRGGGRGNLGNARKKTFIFKGGLPLHITRSLRTQTSSWRPFVVVFVLLVLVVVAVVVVVFVVVVGVVVVKVPQYNTQKKSKRMKRLPYSGPKTWGPSALWSRGRWPRRPQLSKRPLFPEVQTIRLTNFPIMYMSNGSSEGIIIFCKI